MAASVCTGKAISCNYMAYSNISAISDKHKKWYSLLWWYIWPLINVSGMQNICKQQDRGCHVTCCGRNSQFCGSSFHKRATVGMLPNYNDSQSHFSVLWHSSLWLQAHSVLRRVTWTRFILYHEPTHTTADSTVNPSTSELNPSEQCCLPRFFTGDFKFYCLLLGGGKRIS